MKNGNCSQATHKSENCQSLAEHESMAGLVSKETVEWKGGGGGRVITRKSGFINWVDNVNWPPWRVSKADVSSVSFVSKLVKHGQQWNSRWRGDLGSSLSQERCVA